MKQQREDNEELECTDEELGVFGDFFEAARDGRNPDIEEYLKRAPGSADRLRPILETVVKLCAEIEKLRAENPGVDLARLLDPRRRGGG